MSEKLVLFYFSYYFYLELFSMFRCDECAKYLELFSLFRCDECAKYLELFSMFRCDECAKCYHFSCLNPPVKKTPKEHYQSINQFHIWKCDILPSYSFSYLKYQGCIILKYPRVGNKKFFNEGGFFHPSWYFF